MPDSPNAGVPGNNNRLNESLSKSIITEPLYGKVRADMASVPPSTRPHRVIIEINLEFAAGRQAAVDAARGLLVKVVPVGSVASSQSATLPFLFAQMTSEEILKLVELNEEEAKEHARGRPIYHIWDDHEVSSLIVESVRTVKADAARVAFGARGQGITWAVLDSGIDANHLHFQSEHKNLELQLPLAHWDFTGLDAIRLDQPSDPYGHGSHVAGIIAGSFASSTGDGPLVLTAKRQESADGVKAAAVNYSSAPMGPGPVTGVAPAAKLVSMRVLDENGKGRTSAIISAIEKILEINDYGRYLVIHGANLSVGYAFEPEWFACGQSPVCVAVNRLVRSGVVVVVAAGNTGYGLNRVQFGGPGSAGLMVSINDPGNAQDAITVGATHRDSPHVYGVSYFSSKGPTGDGRLKPDLVAPGEKIQSCATGKLLTQTGFAMPPGDQPRAYLENSGTSMAAPHVSGAVAAFLSIRREFIGQPTVVKKIFLDSATDLGRERYFQGSGLLDLMRVIQSV
ncbi:S8 family peptidase [uncultured Paludibaculum sp.]|uniref:S8 family peptidase n=1 Tax=uncultured Paludibaculum sp. TaxID=1765020 RepID=UPI002AAB9EA7|nr:S8 family peptidase [uncultured Paludibaculum sp.]